MGKLIKEIATLSRLGSLPASGTIGSLVALPCAYGVSFFIFPYNYLFVLCLAFGSLFIIDRALPYFTQADPCEIIIDEFIGMLITLVGISYHPVWFLFGFLLFRLFDIFKPLGIHYIEKLPGAYGILLDDCVAGLCAHLILYFFFV